MENNKLKVIEITKAELTKSKENILNSNQLSFLLQKTPEDHIYKRPAKGGGTWDFVTGVYVKKVLNLIFGWDWDFEVVEYKYDLEISQVIVLGKLTFRSNGNTVVKMQFGTKDITFKNDYIEGKKVKTKNPLDLGNDLKAATTSALKKCASELGIASDVYAPNEFKAIKVVDGFETKEEKETEIKRILDESDLSHEDTMWLERVLEEKDSLSYDKIIKTFK